MVLLYLTFAYFVGIVLGQLLWDASWIGCAFPTWLWVLPLALLPFAPLLNRWKFIQPQNEPSLRWPESAGFVQPRTDPSLALIVACLLCLGAGAFRYASNPLAPCWTPANLAYYNLPSDSAFDREAPQVTVTGYVSSYPLISDTKQRLHVDAETLKTDEGIVQVHGTIRLNTGTRERYRYGQPIRLRGRLVTPPVFEDFSYRDYLSRKGVHSLLYSAQIDLLPGDIQGSWLKRQLYVFRARGEALLNRLLPEPYAALGNGMLLGIEAGIPDDLYEEFNLTGTTHTLVISGSNVALISAMFMAIGQRLLGSRRAIWPALVGISLYALIVGGDPAVLRAALMGGLYVVAVHLGRRSTATVSLALACWVMTIFNPLTLWDVGFQLSSAATAGLILFSPGILNAASRIWPALAGGPLTSDPASGLGASSAKWLSGFIQDGLLITIAANVTTLPLVVYYFGRLSIVSLLTNLLISPVQPFIMLWGSLGIVIGVAGLTWVAWLLLLVPWLSLIWTVEVVKWTASLPGASLDITTYNLFGLTLTYVLIFGLYWRDGLRERAQRWFNWIFTDWRQKVLGPSAAGVLGVGCVLLLSGIASQPDGRLHVYFLDIGQGDGIFIETPSGRQVLIDGGESPQTLFSELGAVMPFWDRSIDLVVLTHPDADHMAAQVQVPERFTVEAALETLDNRLHEDAVAWRAAMQDGGADLQVQSTGGWVDLGDGVALWVLWPPPEGYVGEDADNENSLVMKLVYGDFSVLLTGDIGHPSEKALIASNAPIASTVLKVGHHGSKGSTNTEFASAVAPSVAIIQAGADNDYGHPHPEVLEALRQSTVLRNDIHGRVHIWSDGGQMWVGTEAGVAKRP